MKSFLLILISLLCFGSVIAQKKSRKDFFGGPKDYRNFKNSGLQFGLGLTTMFAKNTTQNIDNRNYYSFEPSGRLGAFGDIGTAYFNTGNPKKFINKLFKYLDWGVGGVLYGGSESTYSINTTTNSRTYIGGGKFYTFSIRGRVTAHHMWYIPKTSIFLDNGIGLNIDYRVLRYNSYSKNEDELKGLGIEQTYSNPFSAQIHYNFGVGFKLKRGSYMIPNILLPIAEAHEEIKDLTPKMYWFSSKYWPVMFSLKFIYLFEKKVTGCENFGSEEDRKRNEEYMQNK